MQLGYMFGHAFVILVYRRRVDNMSVFDVFVADFCLDLYPRVGWR